MGLPTETNEIRQKLEAEKTRIAGRIMELEKQDPFSDTERANDIVTTDSEAGEEADHDRMQALIEELHAELMSVDAALMRVSDGTYGICQSCNNHIEPPRLSLVPTAAYCATCEKQAA